MQSYLDVSMLAVIAIAVLLLTLLLISFLLCTRRLTALEQASEKQAAAGEVLRRDVADLKDQVEAALQRQKVAEQSVTYLSTHAQDFDDSQEALKKDLKALSKQLADLEARLNQRVQALESVRTENAPIIEARQMLRAGEDLSEIAKRTSLPRSELEMIAKVSGIKPRPAAPVPESAPAAPAPRGAPKEPEPAESAPAPRHIASLRARSAYGIPARPTLRRR